MTLETKEGPWTKAEVDQLVTLWDSGLSASLIANALGAGKSRNAVIGKLHRMGKTDKNRAMPSEPKERPRPPKPERQKPSMPRIGGTRMKIVRGLPVPVAVEMNGEKITIPNLENGMCRWPIGDPCKAGFHFCGHAQREGAPYCEHHCAVAYAPSQTNRNLRHTTSENKVMKVVAR